VAVLLWNISIFVAYEVAKASVLRVAGHGTTTEARTTLMRWSQGLARCGTQRGGRLPSSTTPVPEELKTVRFKPYQSSPSDWKEDGYQCAGFSLSEPQSFQYSWVLRSATEGVATIRGDRTNMSEDLFRMEVVVSCSGGKCEVGPMPEVTTALERLLAPNKKPQWGLAGLGVLIGLGWLLYEAFVVSIGWGIAVWLVPCASIFFASSHWRVAKRPALTLWISSALFVLAQMWSPGGGAQDAPKRPRNQVAAATETAVGNAPPPAEARPVAPPIPSAGPLPAFDGGVVDLSSVMGRARKLANEWQADATLLGIEATAQSGKIQPALGGRAKLSFGPSPFGADVNPKRPGLFVVTYDQTGIHGAPQPGKPSVALPEPMCSPEAVLSRVSDWGTGALQLRYGVDSAARPSWLVSPASDPKQLRLFEPQACAPRGIKVGPER
jgi:hypothetical protein